MVKLIAKFVTPLHLAPLRHRQMPNITFRVTLIDQDVIFDRANLEKPKGDTFRPPSLLLFSVSLFAPKYYIFGTHDGPVYIYLSFDGPSR